MELAGAQAVAADTESTSRQEDWMQSSFKRTRLLCAALLLTTPAVAAAQENATANGAATNAAAANDTLADPTIDYGNDLGTASNTEATVLPSDGTLANDMAPAQEALPQEDRDFPWGLLGLLGLAGLLGRKKRDDVYVASGADRRGL